WGAKSFSPAVPAAARRPLRSRRRSRASLMTPISPAAFWPGRLRGCRPRRDAVLPANEDATLLAQHRATSPCVLGFAGGQDALRLGEDKARRCRHHYGDSVRAGGVGGTKGACRQFLQLVGLYRSDGARRFQQRKRYQGPLRYLRFQRYARGEAA